jgi:hypothetical protein
MVVSTFRKEKRQGSTLLAARSDHSHYYFRLAGSQGAPRFGREQLITSINCLRREAAICSRCRLAPLCRDVDRT